MSDPVTQSVGAYLGGKAAKKKMTPNIPDAPGIGSASVIQAAMEEAQRRKRAKGYRSTILSSFMGGGENGLKQTLGE